MQRALVVVVTLVAAGWVRVIAAQALSSSYEATDRDATDRDATDRTGEAWPSRTTSSGQYRAVAPPGDRVTKTGSAWFGAAEPYSGRMAGDETNARFGSGLEEDAPVRAPSVFLSSGLEGPMPKPSTAKRCPITRFGSGLEDDAPERPINVFLQSGLEASSALDVTQRKGRAQPRDGTRAPVLAISRLPGVFYRPGF